MVSADAVKDLVDKFPVIPRAAPIGDDVLDGLVDPVIELSGRVRDWVQAMTELVGFIGPGTGRGQQCQYQACDQE